MGRRSRPAGAPLEFEHLPGRINPPEGPGVIPSTARNLALIVFPTYAPAIPP
jgi:hypothetical protein